MILTFGHIIALCFNAAPLQFHDLVSKKCLHGPMVRRNTGTGTVSNNLQQTQGIFSVASVRNAEIPRHFGMFEKCQAKSHVDYEVFFFLNVSVL